MKNTNKKKLPTHSHPEEPDKTNSRKADSADHPSLKERRLFEENLISYGKRLYAYLYNRCRDEDLSKDMMQETLIAAHEQLLKGHFDEKGLSWFWLQKVAQNRLLDHYRTCSVHHALRQANQNRICDNLGWTRNPSTEELRMTRDKNENIWNPDNPEHIKCRIGLNLELLLKSNFRLLRMSDADRWLIKQRHIHEKTFKELSAIMDKPLSTVTSHYYTVMKKVQRQLLSLESIGIFDKKLKRKDLYLLERSMGTKYKRRCRRKRTE
ncbi:MAG: RNA polymerase sigma factor [Bacteroidales bacterium]|nr:RNA polymerase sigma factor [Bacteroidales bacterium]MDE7071784.1 RNA polymerase sigma factor [Bacteroidales bacterium]